MDFTEHLNELDFSENIKFYLWSIPAKWTS